MGTTSSGGWGARAAAEAFSIYDRSGELVSAFQGAAGQFGPRGLIATFGESNPIQIWHWRREELIATLPASAEQVIFDPSGQRIATDDLEIWDVASEKISLRLPVSPPNNVTFAFSPDGTRLAVATANEVKVFDAVSGAEQQGVAR
jgi:WD40 repeat protein